MLRQSGKELGNIQCVSAFHTRDIILQKNADQQPPRDGTPVMEDVLDEMSNLILNTKHDFCNNMDQKSKQQ